MGVGLLYQLRWANTWYGFRACIHNYILVKHLSKQDWIYWLNLHWIYGMGAKLQKFKFKSSKYIYFIPYITIRDILRDWNPVGCIGVLVPTLNAHCNDHVLLNHVNCLGASFISKSIHVYLQFISFFHIDMARLVETHPRVRQRLSYSS